MKTFKVTILLCLLIFFSLPLIVLAADAEEAATSKLPLYEGLDEAAEEAELIEPSEISKDTDVLISQKIGSILKIILGLVGVVFVLMIIYGGFLWMISGTAAAGDKKTVQTGKSYIVNATIGLILTVLSYAIVNYIFNLFSSQV